MLILHNLNKGTNMNVTEFEIYEHHKRELDRMLKNQLKFRSNCLFI